MWYFVENDGDRGGKSERVADGERGADSQAVDEIVNAVSDENHQRDTLEAEANFRPAADAYVTVSVSVIVSRRRLDFHAHVVRLTVPQRRPIRRPVYRLNSVG